jgi:TetR/AcrR family transcriptional regulator, repressor for neighboring sulfatase
METKPRRRSRREPPPRGRDAVMAAVQAAAVELLAERGPREVTVRAVAERARVNHALIHRHFGTKDGLIRAVVTQQSRELAEQAATLARDDTAGMLQLLKEHGAYWRVLARVVLDDPSLLGAGQLPAAAATLAMIAGGDTPDDDTRVAAAVAASTALGWLVFGPHLANVLNLRDTRTFDQEVGAAVQRSVARRGVSRRRGARAGPAG